MKSAVLFDFDGTLAFMQPSHRELYEQAINECNKSTQSFSVYEFNVQDAWEKWRTDKGIEHLQYSRSKEDYHELRKNIHANRLKKLNIQNNVEMISERIIELESNTNFYILYDDVIEYDEDTRNEINKEPFNLKEFKNSINISDIHGEKDYSTIERKSIRPTLDVNGIWGGYMGEGSKTVIPSEAHAKISMRLVPNQDWKKISKIFKDYFISIAPKSVNVIVKTHHGGYPYLTPSDNPGYKAAYMAYNETFGIKPLRSNSGGSIPIVPMFEKELKTKSILMGFGLDTDDIHSPNEHFGLFNFFKGIETIEKFYKYYSEIIN